MQMMKMRHGLFLALLMLAPVLKSGTALALSCSAQVTNLSFGNLSNTLPQTQTSGTVTFSCIDGGAASEVNVCLTIGAGTGGAGSNLSPRYLRRDPGNELAYQLSPGSDASSVWRTVDTVVSLKDGTGSTNIPIYATITGSGVPAGTYSSAFGAGQAEMKFIEGAGDCAISGLVGSVNQFTVSAGIDASCTISAGSLDFGSFEDLSQPIAAATTLGTNCTTATPFSISMGLDPGESADARKMKKGTGESASELTYQLYSDSARTAIWGDGSNDVVTGVGTGSSQSLTVYGLIPSQRVPPPGTYTDTVVVTITY
jgi:spore coat protein U-like protein